MVNHVICRRTGQVVATGYQTYIGQGGKKYRFFHKDWQKDMDLTKQQFDANYRIEKVEYKWVKIAKFTALCLLMC